MKFNCSNNCKMTKELRMSKLCESSAEVIDGKVIFSCQKNLLAASELENNFYNCQLWDNQIFDACNSCELKCKNNINKNMKISAEQSAELKAIIDSLRPSMILYGVNDKVVESISKEYIKSKDKKVKYALDAAKISNDSMKLIQKGRPIDIAYLSIVSSRLLKKIK